MNIEEETGAHPSSAYVLEVMLKCYYVKKENHLFDT